MMENEINFSNQTERIAFKNHLLDEVKSIIVFLEKIAQKKSGDYLSAIDTVKSNLNEFSYNLQTLIEPRDKSRVAEFYRLSELIINRFKERYELVEVGFDFPISDEFMPYSAELVKLSVEIRL